MFAVPVFAHDSSRTAHILSSKNMIFEFRSNTKLFVTHRKSCCTIRIILLSSFYSNLQGLEKFELENLQVDWPFKILNSSSQVLINNDQIHLSFYFYSMCASEYCLHIRILHKNIIIMVSRTMPGTSFQNTQKHFSIN